ncbi:MAG: O-antigen ligase family protein [Flavobacteriales bacterium]|nr:O-antigen ligase family protein [Flavobacteriales bacterium]
MQISKRKLINTLFLLGFPCYGIGFYLGVKQAFTAGMVFSALPFILILAIHGIDLIYRGQARVMVNRIYWIALAFLISMAAGMWVAMLRGFPGYNLINTTGQTIMILIPFNAAVVVRIVNLDDPRFDMAGLMLKSLSLLIGINFLGYASGMSNLVHSFPGRISLPFMRGIYDAAHLLSIINLMLLFHLRDPLRKPITFAVLGTFFLVNTAVMVDVNSRLSFLVFLVLTVLFITRVMRRARYVYAISLFTLPLLLSFALLIYQVLTLPIFEAILSRVSKEDVTTFNGRSYIWYAAWDWLVNDRRGLLFGGGYNAQHALGFMKRIARLWGVERPALIHMHSSSLQILMAQGVTGFALMCTCLWYAYDRFRKFFRADTKEAPLFAAVVYLLFIWQVDIFCYGLDFGIPILFCMLAYIAVDTAPSRQGGVVAGPAVGGA